MADRDGISSRFEGGEEEQRFGGEEAVDPLRQSPLDADQRLRNLEQSIIDLGAQSSQAIAALDQRFTTWMGQVGGTIAQIGQQVNANTQQTQAASGQAAAAGQTAQAAGQTAQAAGQAAGLAGGMAQQAATAQLPTPTVAPVKPPPPRRFAGAGRALRVLEWVHQAEQFLKSAGLEQHQMGVYHITN